MGYYSDFTISIEQYNDTDQEFDADEFSVKFEAITDYEITDAGEYWYLTSVKWYDNETQMREISKLWPDYLFSLKRVGEEENDMVMEYYLDGKLQKVAATISFPPFDKNELK